MMKKIGREFLKPFLSKIVDFTQSISKNIESIREWAKEKFGTSRLYNINVLWHDVKEALGIGRKYHYIKRYSDEKVLPEKYYEVSNYVFTGKFQHVVRIVNINEYGERNVAFITVSSNRRLSKSEVYRKIMEFNSPLSTYLGENLFEYDFEVVALKMRRE